MNLLLSPWVWRTIAATVILAGLAWVYNWWADGQREIGRDEVRAEWNIDKLARAESNRLLLMANAKRQGDLQVAADKPHPHTWTGLYERAHNILTGAEL